MIPLWGSLLSWFNGSWRIAQLAPNDVLRAETPRILDAWSRQQLSVREGLYMMAHL